VSSPFDKQREKRQTTMIKPGSRDIKVNMFIAGEELEELQKHTWSMAEAFGLDRRIEQYKRKRPIVSPAVGRDDR
jgi:hypothetical protein